MAKWTIQPPSDFRFEPVVYSHGWFQCAPFRWDAARRRLQRVLLLPGPSPTVVSISETSCGALELEVSGRMPAAGRRAAVERAVTRILAFASDLGSFHSLCRQHPRLASAPALGAGRLLRCPTLWEEMVKSICGTNVAWRQAVRMIDRVCELGETVPGAEDRHAWPLPAAVLDAGESVLRERCRVGYRAGAIVELAGRIESGELDLGPAERGELDAEELRDLFLSVKGIGKATAAYLLLVSGHGRELTIDSSVYAYMAEEYFDGRRPTDAEIRAVYEPFGEWAGLAHWFDGVVNSWWPSAGVVVSP